MSAERREHDAYFTAPPLARAIVERIDFLRGSAPREVIEPHCGGGAFVWAARQVWPEATIAAFDLVDRGGGELVAAHADSFGVRDWLTPGTFSASTDLIIGNPPYGDAEAHVRRSLEVVRPGGMVAFLLRLSFLASQGRLRGVSASGSGGMGLFGVHPIAPRPSFTGQGSDNSEYALFVWKRGWSGAAEIGVPLFWGAAAPVRSEPAPERLAQFKDAETKGQLPLLAVGGAR